METVISILTPVAAAVLGHLLFLGASKISGLTLKSSSRTGKILGFLERALIAVFVMAGRLEATVFIFAAKAAVIGFRLPNDQKGKKEEAEYMLVGTMISYLIGIAFGYCGKGLLDQ